MSVINNKEGIQMFVICALKARLKLEMKGMKFKGRGSAYKRLKEIFGVRGSREKVLALVTEYVNDAIGECDETPRD